ncbi:MAG: beta-hydroxyacyl-ACP dehydratase [Planctomycetes bacterium]|nr:beta-hydroxyacyl-ACP dehydratase [Planctomycetota bacterium]
MPPKLLIDPAIIDVNNIYLDKTKVESINPHRYEMQQLDGILKFDKANNLIVGYKDVTTNEFWVRGHIPGRPIMPGVLMVEAAAQLSSVYYHLIEPAVAGKFVGFGGIDQIKFRGTVQPGDKLILVIKCRDMRPRRGIFYSQGIVNGKLVFEAVISGMPV